MTQAHYDLLEVMFFIIYYYMTMILWCKCRQANSSITSFDLYSNTLEIAYIDPVIDIPFGG